MATFFGRPKIDRLIVKFFRDAAPMSVALLAGDYDVMTPGSLKINDLDQVLDVFYGQGGKLITSLSDVGWARLQFRDPEAPWVRDVRVRQALQHLLDRQSLADTFSPDMARPTSSPPRARRPTSSPSSAASPDIPMTCRRRTRFYAMRVGRPARTA